ncbi:MAG: hypothetical protein HQL69_05405 [Magnetococcales bacterium]|nr:hypothetical protein [Magnetococcales bacterium]
MTYPNTCLACGGKTEVTIHKYEGQPYNRARCLNTDQYGWKCYECGIVWHDDRYRGHYGPSMACSNCGDTGLGGG